MQERSKKSAGITRNKEVTNMHRKRRKTYWAVGAKTFI
jgi:hypothetical protein